MNTGIENENENYYVLILKLNPCLLGNFNDYWNYNILYYNTYPYNILVKCLLAI